MNHHTQQSRTHSWMLALTLPGVAGCVGWLWAEATFASDCIAGPGSPGLVGLVLLVLAVPLSIGWHAKHTAGSVTLSWAPMFVGPVLAAPLVWFAFLIAAGSHGCFA